jgi:hypothetical protein
LEERRFVPDLVRVGDPLIRLPRSQLFGQHVPVPDAEWRSGRDGRKSSCLSEEFPTISERQMMARHGGPSLSEGRTLGEEPTYTTRLWLSSI